MEIMILYLRLNQTRSPVLCNCQKCILKATGYFCIIKVKCTLVQALKLCTGRTAQRGSRGIALLFHDHGTRRG